MLNDYTPQSSALLALFSRVSWNNCTLQMLSVRSQQGERLDIGRVSRAESRREGLLFLLLAVVIWPFIAVAVVGGFGFMVWMYQILTGPPGPV